VADDEVAIGIVGRLVPVKNHDLFLQGLKYAMENSDRRIRAFVVGDGEERERLEALTSELGLSRVQGPYFNGHGFGHGVNGHPMTDRADVTFTSWIKEIDIVNAGVDLVALTSHNEGTPVSLIEAQAACKPVVSTKVGGIENVVLEGRTALLSPSGEVEGFGRNLLELVENDARREAMSSAGWDHVHQRFHYQRLVQDTAALYRELLG
jgi:glycosyltransferase involved in cell wall biosynthesis